MIYIKNICYIKYIVITNIPINSNYNRTFRSNKNYSIYYMNKIQFRLTFINLIKQYKSFSYVRYTICIYLVIIFDF